MQFSPKFTGHQSVSRLLNSHINWALAEKDYFFCIFPPPYMHEITIYPMKTKGMRERRQTIYYLMNSLLCSQNINTGADFQAEGAKRRTSSQQQEESTAHAIGWRASCEGENAVVRSYRNSFVEISFSCREFFEESTCANVARGYENKFLRRKK